MSLYTQREILRGGNLYTYFIHESKFSFGYNSRFRERSDQLGFYSVFFFFPA